MLSCSSHSHPILGSVVLEDFAIGMVSTDGWEHWSLSDSIPLAVCLALDASGVSWSCSRPLLVFRFAGSTLMPGCCSSSESSLSSTCVVFFPSGLAAGFFHSRIVPGVITSQRWSCRRSSGRCASATLYASVRLKAAAGFLALSCPPIRVAYSYLGCLLRPLPVNARLMMACRE